MAMCINILPRVQGGASLILQRGGSGLGWRWGIENAVGEVGVGFGDDLLITSLPEGKRTVECVIVLWYSARCKGWCM